MHFPLKSTICLISILCLVPNTLALKAIGSIPSLSPAASFVC